MSPITSSVDNITTANPDIQYKIIWDFLDEKGLVHRNQEAIFADKAVAVEIWYSLKRNPNIVNMRSKTIEKEYNVVDVMYFNDKKKYSINKERFYPKVYTFLTKNVITSKYVVVATNGILQTVSVVSCYKATRTILETKRPFKEYSYIVGTVEKER